MHFSLEASGWHAYRNGFLALSSHSLVADDGEEGVTLQINHRVKKGWGAAPANDDGPFAANMIANHMGAAKCNTVPPMTE